jgi:hypothetical protein
VPETCFPIGPSNGRGVSKDRHAAYLIKARRTNLHPKAGYIDADFLSLNFSLAVRRRTIHLGNYGFPAGELAAKLTSQAQRDSFRIARRPVAFIHRLVKLIVRHSLSVTTRSWRDGLRADHHNDSTVGDVIPISIMFRVIADVLAVRYRDAFVENGFTNLAA